jgi:hypothetical protein
MILHQKEVCFTINITYLWTSHDIVLI